MSKFKDALYPLSAALGLILAWQGFVSYYAIPDYLLPGPFAVIKMMFSEWSLIYPHVLITLFEAGVGFLLALIIANYSNNYYCN